MTERTAVVTPTDVRYGFQGQEEDDELWNGAVSFKYRVEDARLGRFFSVDPKHKEYPWNSSYAFSENRLLDAVELEGLECVLMADVPRLRSNGSIKLSVGNEYVVAGYSFRNYMIATSIMTFGPTSKDIESKTNFTHLKSRIELYFIKGLCQDAGEELCSTFTGEKEYNVGQDLASVDNTFRHFLGVTLSNLVNGQSETEYIFDAHERHDEGARLRPGNDDFVADIINNAIAIEFSNSIRDDFRSKSDVTREKVCGLLNEITCRVMEQYYLSPVAQANHKIDSYSEFKIDSASVIEISEYLQSNLPE